MDFETVVDNHKAVSVTTSLAPEMVAGPDCWTLPAEHLEQDHLFFFLFSFFEGSGHQSPGNTLLHRKRMCIGILS